MYFFRAFVKELAKSLKLAKKSSQRSNLPMVDNHLPSGPLLGPKKIPDDSDDDYIDDDVEQGGSSTLVLKVDLKEDDYQPLVGWNVGRIFLQVLEILPTL